MDELKCRKRVLRRLGYSNDGDVIQLKGRVACELSSADELLLTEMIFNGTFVDLQPAKAAALLSCFVCDERSNDAPKLTDDLSGALKNMQVCRQNENNILRWISTSWVHTYVILWNYRKWPGKLLR